MSVTTYDIGFEGLDALAGVDALCLFVAEDDRPLPGTAGYVDWRLCGALSRVLKKGFFTGVKDDWLLLPSDGRLPFPRVFAVGLGRREGPGRGQALGQALASAAQVLTKAKVESVALELPSGGQAGRGRPGRGAPAALPARLSRASRWRSWPTRPWPSCCPCANPDAVHVGAFQGGRTFCYHPRPEASEWDSRS